MHCEKPLACHMLLAYGAVGGFPQHRVLLLQRAELLLQASEGDTRCCQILLGCVESVCLSICLEGEFVVPVAQSFYLTPLLCQLLATSLVYMYIYVYICIYVYMYICIYVYMYVCVCVCVCVCVYIVG